MPTQMPPTRSHRPTGRGVALDFNFRLPFIISAFAAHDAGQFIDTVRCVDWISFANGFII